MIDPVNIVVWTSDIAIKPELLNQVPLNQTNDPSPGDIEALLNLGALDVAVPNDDETASRENANLAARTLGAAIYALKHYLLMGKAPTKLQHPSVVGTLAGGQWTLFVPACGVVMRCNALLGFASQTFQYLGSYHADAYSKINDGSSGYDYKPWHYPALLYGALPQALAERQPFWTLHMKTAEVI